MRVLLFASVLLSSRFVRTHPAAYRPCFLTPLMSNPSQLFTPEQDQAKVAIADRRRKLEVGPSTLDYQAFESWLSKVVEGIACLALETNCQLATKHNSDAPHPDKRTYRGRQQSITDWLTTWKEHLNQPHHVQDAVNKKANVRLNFSDVAAVLTEGRWIHLVRAPELRA